MDYNLICELCGEQLQVNSTCTCPLGDHLLKLHPDADLTFFSSFEDLTVKYQSCVKIQKEPGTILTKFENPIWICANQSSGSSTDTNNVVIKCTNDKLPRKKKTVVCRYPNNRLTKKKTVKNSTVYSTTVETWKQSYIKVRCPKCKIIDRPELRKRTTKVIEGPLKIILMLTCWPICFFPFLTSQRNELEVFCRSCGYNLGDYGRELNCICNN